MANKKQKVTIYWNTRHIKLEDIPEVKKKNTGAFLVFLITQLLMVKRIVISVRKIWNCFGKRKNVASFKYVISPHENGVKMAKFLFA